MRTFHTGGVSNTDITRVFLVQEIFEARIQKGVITEVSGNTAIEEDASGALRKSLSRSNFGEGEYVVLYTARMSRKRGRSLGAFWQKGFIQPNNSFVCLVGWNYLLAEVQKYTVLRGIMINTSR